MDNCNRLSEWSLKFHERNDDINNYYIVTDFLRCARYQLSTVKGVVSGIYTKTTANMILLIINKVVRILKYVSVFQPLL